LFLLAVSAVAAQPNSVTAYGSATIGFNPNQAQFSVGVVTQATTAQDAAAQNATISTTVQNALKAALGNQGTVQTISYSVTPRFNNSNPPTIVGYTASNTVEVTSYNLNIIGSLIDTATKAGANNIGGVSFGLQNPDPFIQQALTAATKQAQAYAGAIAAGTGGHLGAVISAQQGYSFAPTGVVTGAPSGTTSTVPTPIQAGSVNVTATVTLTVQLLQ